MRSINWNGLLVGMTMIFAFNSPVHAETYLTEQQAAARLFPSLKMEPHDSTLTPGEVKTIEKASGERVLDPHIHALWGPDHEVVFIDKVVGKHEFITYAVAIAKEEKVEGIEIMDYRETYGSEVRRPEWRKQFKGKTAQDRLKAGKDIDVISGASLSSVHITNGVRRVLQTYAILKPKT